MSVFGPEAYDPDAFEVASVDGMTDEPLEGGWGGAAYGTSVYGAFAGSISLASAWAITTHAVRVNLTAEPAHVDQFAVGDALNVATWSIVDASAAPRTVLGVTMHSTTAVEIQVLEPLGSHLVDLTVTAVGLVSATGLPATSPLSAAFVGVVQTIDPIDAVTADQFRDRDLANPPFQLERGLGTAGTLVIGPDGDYDTEAGAPLIRKLLVRRLSTPRGSLRNLPNYGVGIIEKEPVPCAADLIALRTEIESQALEEPDVAQARARLTMDRSGVLIVQLSAVPKTGAAVTIRMGAAHGRLVEI